MKKVLNTKNMNITTSDYVKVEDNTQNIDNSRIDKFINTFLIVFDLIAVIILLFVILLVIGIIVGKVELFNIMWYNYYVLGLIN